MQIDVIRHKWKAVMENRYSESVNVILQHWNELYQKSNGMIFTKPGGRVILKPIKNPLYFGVGPNSITSIVFPFF